MSSASCGARTSASHGNALSPIRKGTRLELCEHHNPQTRGVLSGQAQHHRSAPFDRNASTSSEREPTVFLSVAVFMDTFVVAILIERSFRMFQSIVGAWLPFGLIFLSTGWTGLAVRRAVHPAAK